MKINKKMLWMIAISAMVLGLILGSIGLLCGGANGKYVVFNQSGMHLITESPHTVKWNQKFQSLNLDVQRYDIHMVKSDHYGVEISYRYDIDKPSCQIENGALNITDHQKEANWVLDFGIFKKENIITVYAPANVTLKDMNIKDSDGNADLSNFTAQTADLNLSFGNLHLNNASMNELSVTMGNGEGWMQNIDTNKIVYHNAFGNSHFTNIKGAAPQSAEITAQNGDINLKNFNTKVLSIDNSFGNIQMDNLNVIKLSSNMQNGRYIVNNSKIGNASITNKFGNIDASNVTSTQLKANNQNGDIKLNGTFYGDTSLQSKFGNVDITTSLSKEQYSYSFNAQMGDVRVNDSKNALNAQINKNAKNNLVILNQNGDIHVHFGI